MEEQKLNALNDEALDQVSGGNDGGNKTGLWDDPEPVPEPTTVRWCDYCKRNMNVPGQPVFCPNCGNPLSEPH